MDHVNEILRQWQQERPDLDVRPMATTGRVKRLAHIFGQEMEQVFSQFDLNNACFDVLATLRRSGPPYALPPGKLMASTMVTSGTMTNRIDQLEKVGLVRRIQSEDDKRSFSIELTAKGLGVIDKAVTQHVKNLHRLTGILSKKEEAALNKILLKMLVHFESKSR